MTYQAFPFSDAVAAPAYYTDFEWTARNGIHYEGDNVVATLDQATATDYDVVCLVESPHAGYELGDVVATGAVSGTTLNLGAFSPGCYRVRLYGASSDADYGDSYGASNFAVIRANANFPTLPASVDNPAEGGGYIPKGQGAAFLGNPVELITFACLGIGTNRLSIRDTADPNSTGSDKLSDAVLAVDVHNSWWWDPAYLDPVRERKQWVAFENGTTDLVRIQPDYLDVGIRDASIDGSKVFVAATSAGGTGGSDIIHVYYPDSVTLVETYDNLLTQTDAITAINGVSNYIWVWRFGNVDRLNTRAVAAIGTAYADGIREIVATLYPLGVTHYEGPSNEPSLASASLDEPETAAHHMRLVQGFVHDAAPAAIAMGPCTVDITTSATPARYREYFQHWVDFNDEPDAISFHDYNSVVNGDINCGRNSIEPWADVVAEFGWENKERWQTEANHNFSSIAAGVYHPGRSRVTMARVMLWEQYGVPLEKNPWWYAYSHGFWSYASFAFHGYSGDKSPNPPVVTLCVYAQEIYGKAWHHAVDFGHVVANRMFVGNVYGDAITGSVAALMCASYMPDSTVTLEIVGTTDPIVVVDGAGNELSYAQSSGKITVPVLAHPTYVRLPVGANMRVDHIRDWASDEPPSVSILNGSTSLGGVPAPELADETYLSAYAGGTSSPGIVYSASSLPDSAQIFLEEEKTIGRVITFHGPAWEQMSYPLDHTVDALPPGTILPSLGGPSLPGTAANDAAAGDGAWSNPNGILDVGGNFSNASLSTGQTSQYLHATNFGFAVPGGATILGVIVDGNIGASGNTTVVDHTVRLLDAGVMAGTNNASLTAWNWNPFAVRHWGGSEDLWGIALTSAKVNASTFGVSIRVTCTAAATITSPAVDYIKISVYYTTGTWPLPWSNKADPAVHVASSVLFGTDATNAGCQRETYTQEPWITDDSFTPVSTQGIKYAVADASYGGEPDADCIITNGGLNLSGHGADEPKVAIQEIAVLSATTITVGTVPSVPTSSRAPLVSS